jgi:membrane protein DedA with SNARE-associated domain
MQLDTFLAAYGLLAVFVVMLLKEFGIPVPIPGDLIMLGVAAQAASSQFDVALAFLVIFVPMLIGGMFQYAVARGPGRRLIYRIGRFIGLTQARLDVMMERVRRGGSAAVAIGLSTPGVRIATTPASGLANLEPRRYVPGLIAGSAFFLGWHFALGYAGGAAIEALNIPTPVLIGIGVAVLGFGVLAAVIRYRRKSRTKPTLGETYTIWADACCPVCASVTLMQDARTERHERHDQTHAATATEQAIEQAIEQAQPPR